jgi:putative inorganic carbon (HCO3(-)) transporter
MQRAIGGGHFISRLRSRGSSPLQTAAVGVLLSAGCVLSGAALVAVASRFGPAAPMAMVAIPVLPIVAYATLRDPRVGIVAVFATFSFSSILGTIGPTPLELVEGAVLTVATLVVLRNLAMHEQPLAWAPSLWLWVLLIGWTIVALPSALDELLAIKQLASLVGGLLLVCIVVGVCRTLDDVRWVAGALVAVGAFISALAIVTGGQMSAAFGGAVVTGRLEGGFTQPNQLGSFCALVALVAMGLALGAATIKSRIVYGLAAAVITVGLLLSLSRGGWIGWGLGMVALVLIVRSAARTLLVVGIPVLLLAVGVGVLGSSTAAVEIVGTRLASFTAENPYDSRPEIWAEGLREVQQDPWTGQGPGNFPVASVRGGSEVSTVYASHAHNILLTWAAEAGLPSALLIVGLSLSLIREFRGAKRSMSRANRRHLAMLGGIGAALVSVAGQGIVDYTFRNQVAFFAICSVIGLLLAARRATRNEINRSIDPSALGTRV